MASKAKLVIACAAALLIAPVYGAAEVALTGKPPVVEYKTFDPARPPADMPPLKDDEAAVTQSSFECSVAMRCRIVSRRENAGQCRVSLKVNGVDVTVQLKVVIWLPQAAPAKLAAHEEGHRRIAQRVYKEADAAARSLARALDGRMLTAVGSDCHVAQTRASQSAADQFCHDYLELTNQRAGRIGEIYDRLTAHGTRVEPAEDEAIRQAFTEDEKRESTTRPSN